MIRAHIGDQPVFCAVEVGADGTASVCFERFGLDRPGDPVRIVFEALAPRGAGNHGTRAELSVAAFVWPGVSAAATIGDTLPTPVRFLPSRSVGLRQEGPLLHVDDRADAAAPILGVQTAAGPREFRLVVCGERLWHMRVDGGKRRVPRGARLVLGHAERHDTLAVVSDDRDADLLAFGKTVHRPFLGLSRFEIGAGFLDRTPGTRNSGSASGEADDRLTLRRKDGSHVLLARVVRIDDPADVVFTETPEAISLSLTLRSACDALLVRIEDADGTLREGAELFLGNPVETRLPEGHRRASPPRPAASTSRSPGRFSALRERRRGRPSRPSRCASRAAGRSRSRTPTASATPSRSTGFCPLPCPRPRSRRCCGWRAF